MPDISICLNHDCPLRKTCYRHEAEPDPHWQSYLQWDADWNVREDGCPHYWEMGEYCWKTGITASRSQNTEEGEE